jgi:hypothetical protein
MMTTTAPPPCRYPSAGNAEPTQPNHPLESIDADHVSRPTKKGYLMFVALGFIGEAIGVAAGAAGAAGAALFTTTGAMVSTMAVTTLTSVVTTAVTTDQTKKAADKQGKDQEKNALLAATVAYGTNMAGTPLKINT